MGRRGGEKEEAEDPMVTQLGEVFEGGRPSEEVLRGEFRKDARSYRRIAS